MQPDPDVTVERPAGFWRRAAAFLIDAAIILPAGYLLETAVYQAWQATFPDDWQNEGLVWALALTALLILWLYAVLSESSPAGATPGKRLLGISVRAPGGAPPGFARASARFAARLLSAVILGFGFWMAAWSRQKLTLHDRLTRTRVIRA